MRNHSTVRTLREQPGVAPKSPEGHKKPIGGFWLKGIFVFLLIYILDYAEAALIPIALAFFFALVLEPLVHTLEKLISSRAGAIAIVMTTLLGTVAFSSFQLARPIQESISEGPQRISKVENRIRDILLPFQEVDKTMDAITGGLGDAKGQRTVVAQSPGTGLFEHFRSVFSHFALVVILLVFLLATGDRFWEGVWHLCSSKIEKSAFLHLVHDTETRLSSYLMTIAAINLGLGLLVGTAMFGLGMPDPILWGALAAVLNFVPYLGAMIGEIIVGLVALSVFDSVGYALLVPLVYFVIAFTEGNLITPMILGKRFAVKPVLIILSMIILGWLWGIVGVFLTVPTLVLTLIVCENIPRLSELGGFIRK